MFVIGKGSISYDIKKPHNALIVKAEIEAVNKYYELSIK